MIAQPPVSVDEFYQFIQLPENTDKRYELIAGEIVEVVSSNRSSGLASRFIYHLYGFAESHDLGHVTAPDGGYQFAGEQYIPDVAYISYERLPELTDDAYYAEPPELVVEVISPTDSQRKIMVKVGNYLAVGTTVWVVYPDDQVVHVYVPGEKVRILTKTDTLLGDPVLPGFELPLDRIFR